MRYASISLLNADFRISLKGKGNDNALRIAPPSRALVRMCSSVPVQIWTKWSSPAGIDWSEGEGRMMCDNII